MLGLKGCKFGLSLENEETLDRNKKWDSKNTIHVRHIPFRVSWCSCFVIRNSGLCYIFIPLFVVSSCLSFMNLSQPRGIFLPTIICFHGINLNLNDILTECRCMKKVQLWRRCRSSVTSTTKICDKHIKVIHILSEPNSFIFYS